ncbi:MAG: hypothetical protein ABIQ61_02360 [Ornithinibacter sp.]
MDLATIEPRAEAGRSVLWVPVRRPTVQGVTAGVVVLHVVAVSWLVAGGDLYIDDIRAQAYAAGRPPWPFIIESNGTHLAPGARSVDWLMATYAPLEHWPAVVISVAIAALLGWSTRRLVAQVISHPGAQVLALSWVLFAASVVPTYAWFRQALTTMAAMGLVVLGTSLLITHLRTLEWRPLAAAVGCHALALTFSERAVAVPVVVATLLFVSRKGVRSISLARTAMALAPFVVVNIAFLLAYTSGDFDTAEGAQPGVRDAVVKLGRWVVVDLLPSFIGGPVVWRPGNLPYSYADTPVVLVVVAALALSGMLAVAARTPGAFRRAAPVALVAGSYALPVLGLIYVGRLAQVTEITAADDLRLLPDVSAAVAIALAALVGSVLERRPPQDWTRPWPQRRLFSLAAGCTVLALATTTWVGFGRTWHGGPVGSYLSTLRDAVATRTDPVLPTPVPADIVPGWVDASFTTRPLLELLNPGLVGSTLPGEPSAVSPSGALGPASLQRVAAAPIPDGFCGAVLEEGEQSRTLPLPKAAPYYRGSIVALGLLVGDATRLNITVTDRDGMTSRPLIDNPPELLRGPARIYASIPYGMTIADITVVVQTLNTTGVCITSAQVLTIEGAG